MLVAWLCVLVAPSAHAQCRDDRECRGVRACVQGRCVSLACEDDRDCPPDAMCGPGHCVAAPPPAPVVDVPAAPDPYRLPPAPPVRYERRSTAMMVVGIVCLGVGGASLLAGLSTVALAPRETRCSGFDCPPGAGNSDVARGGAMIGIGAAAVLAGAILTPLGARKIRVDDREIMTLQPFVGPTEAGLRLRF